MALTRQALDNFYAERKPYLETVIGLGFKEYESKFSQMLNMKSASSGWIDVATVSGFGLWDERQELQDAAEDDILQGPVARTKVLEYAKRHIVSQVAIEDDQGDGIIASRLPGIMKTGRATMEVLGHDVYNSGFGSTLTPDGVALISASHKNLMGTTYSNILTAADISQAGLEAAILALETMRDDRNIPIMQTAAKILIHPNSKWLTQVILGSAQVVGSDYNNINPMFTSGLTTVESPYFTDTDGWFLLANEHDLNFHTRIAPENWSDVNYVNSSVEIGARFRSAVSADDPRGVVGSAG
jgi:hypothetical protein